MKLEYRATDVQETPADPEPGLVPDELLYLAYYMGITSTTSIQIEAQQFTFEDEAETGWANATWAKLLDTDARIDLQVGAVWAVGVSNGLRTAVSYGWPAGLNLDLAVRLQISDVEDNRGYQVEMEGQAVVTPATSVWAKGYYYRDDNDAATGQVGAGVAQALGLNTGLHVSAYLGDAHGSDPVDGDLEASSASFRVELRHRFTAKDTLLRMAYFNYFDSWQTGAESYTLKVEQPYEDGLYGVGYRVYRTDEGLETGTWMVTAGYKW